VRCVAATVAAVLFAVLLAGCGSGPSQSRAAAIVGDTKITIESVQSWWDRVLADRELKEQLRANGQFDDLGRVIVREAVRHELLRKTAQREGLQYDEAQVNELIEKLGGEQAAVELTQSIYDRNTIRERARDQLLAIALGRKYFDTTVRFDFMVVGSRDQALAKARELAADPERARSIIQADGRGGAAVGLNQRQSIGDNIDAVLRTPLFSVPAGYVLAYPDADKTGQGQWVVVVIRDRTTGTPSTQPGAITVDRVNESRLEGVGLRMLGLQSREIGVRLNPRYGVWSHEYVAAAQTEGEIPAIVVRMAEPVAS
jgi:SurA N-terminal domain